MFPKIAKKMKNNILDNYEIENIEDCISLIEELYKFKFENGETESVKSFNELNDLIISKIDFKNVDTCTSQQAFYKLRNSLVKEKISEKDNIKLETKLKELFPRKNRIKLIKKVEQNIGFKLNILGPPTFILYSLVLLFLVSLILLFIKWKLGVLGIVLSSFSIYLSFVFGKEIDIDTVKKLVEKITFENYLEIRSQKNTINKSELKKVITDWFVENAGIEKEKLINSTFE